MTKHPLFSISISVLVGLSLFLNGRNAAADYNEHRPVCSPDGTRLIYMLQSERTDDDWELYVMDTDSRVRSRLTSHPGWDGYAVWSPDGTKIVFDRELVQGEPKRPYIMNLEDLSITPLGGVHEGWLSVSDWSNDDHLLGFHELNEQRDLVMLDLEGNIVRKITGTGDYSEHDAHFSPDGQKIAYANGTVDGSETSLEVMDAAGGGREILRTSIGRIYGINWSPNGEKIAFVDAPGGDDDDADIFIYALADQSFKQITDDPAWDHMPAFCADNQTLLFTSYRSGEERIYQLDLDSRPFLKIERANKY